MTALDQRRSLDRLSISYRKLIGGAQRPPPPEQPESPSPAAETPALSPPTSPETPSTPPG